MIWLKDDAVLILEDEIIQHIQRHPDAHHHTLDEMERCCLATTTQIYWLFLDSSVLFAHFLYVRDNENQCKIKSCFCSLPKET